MNRILKLLFDAVIVINAFKLNIWNYLTGNHEISVANSVARKEVEFCSKDGVKEYINLMTEIRKGKLSEIAASPEMIIEVNENVVKKKIEIQLGETESIAILLTEGFGDLQFCTADKAAVCACHLFEKTAKLVSLEQCLPKVHRKKLSYELTTKALERWKGDAVRLLPIE